jgi:hypothetical protein
VNGLAEVLQCIADGFKAAASVGRRRSAASVARASAALQGLISGAQQSFCFVEPAARRLNSRSLAAASAWARAGFRRMAHPAIRVPPAPAAREGHQQLVDPA